MLNRIQKGNMNSIAQNKNRNMELYLYKACIDVIIFCSTTACWWIQLYPGFINLIEQTSQSQNS